MSKNNNSAVHGLIVYSRSLLIRSMRETECFVSLSQIINIILYAWNSCVSNNTSENTIPIKLLSPCNSCVWSNTSENSIAPKLLSPCNSCVWSNTCENTIMLYFFKKFFDSVLFQVCCGGKPSLHAQYLQPEGSHLLWQQIQKV